MGSSRATIFKSEGKEYIETIWGRGYVLRDPGPVRARSLLTAVGSPFEALAFSPDRRQQGQI